MRFLILGATGTSGILLVRKTLELYPDATIIIYARSPDKVPEDLKDNAAVSIIKGTLEDLDTAETAVQGVDVVLSALGPLVKWYGTNHPSGNPIATFYAHLIDLMNKYNVKRFLFLSTASSKDPNDRHSVKFATLVDGVKLFARNAYTDIVAMGETARTKGGNIDWTMVRVPVLTNANTEAVAAGYIGDEQVGVTLSRRAFAAFMLGEVEKREWIQKAPLISDS
ncbi:NAD-P-binding protein [Gymnopilus junonius]|uniref:NAD-P-binding protein n=1 Tax=Gymnopilus junonius TaxID=109634 RepID=A0A9P5NT34_GYMJU|nr:NAD-P-binding protein [Gymnopilus junonius]